ncbi:hypothetical protein H0H92_008859 [Tricholoma furcatifolium]|nr:hypothetical protein H0H92_008859 [Tricholoma furcatifolium]
MQLLLATSALLALLRPHPALGAALARSKVKEVTLDIVNTHLAPDGFERAVITANGQYPGPLITATKGDTLSITVHNRLDWDGIFFSTENVWNEGSSFVTACPIAPGDSFTYNLPSVNDQTGTFCQLSVQYVDGLRGPLIIYDPEDPLAHLYDIDDENTIWQVGKNLAVLIIIHAAHYKSGDWWHNSSVSLLTGYVATGIVPVSDSGTFNGVGRYQGGPEVPFFVQNVEQGKRYRFRIINQSARNVFTMSIDGHDLTVIEADGVATTPMTVNQVLVLAGQRYSVVLEANQPVANYWINAPFTGGNPANNLNQNATLSRAVLRYAGAPEEDPDTPMTLGPVNPNLLIEANLRPLNAETPPQPDINITLNLVVTAGKAQWNVNNVSYLPPEVPTLVKVLNGANSSADFNVTENTFVLPKNAVIQVDFPPNDDDEAHPFHLHGNNFWLIKSNSSDEINTVDPIRRDDPGSSIVTSSGTSSLALRP